jgi:hypothetical protein
LEDKSFALPNKPPEIFLASEMIREFLINLGLDNTLSVFNEEIGQPFEMRVDRELIAGELGLNILGSSAKVPLIVQIIQYLMKNKDETLNKLNDTLLVETDLRDDESEN